eukprot:8059323-Pyramimonas_sp.AAC.1
MLLLFSSSSSSPVLRPPPAQPRAAPGGLRAPILPTGFSSSFSSPSRVEWRARAGAQAARA